MVLRFCICGTWAGPIDRPRRTGPAGCGLNDAFEQVRPRLGLFASQFSVSFLIFQQCTTANCWSLYCSVCNAMLKKETFDNKYFMTVLFCMEWCVARYFIRSVHIIGIKFRNRQQISIALKILNSHNKFHGILRFNLIKATGLWHAKLHKRHLIVKEFDVSHQIKAHTSIWCYTSTTWHWKTIWAFTFSQWEVILACYFFALASAVSLKKPCCECPDCMCICCELEEALASTT